MVINTFNTLILISIFIGFAFVVQTSFSANRDKKEILYLNLFILFFTLHNLQIVFADLGYILMPVFDRKLLLPFYSLVIPSFYTFVTYYLKVQKILQSFVKIAVALFLSQLLLRLLIYLFFYDTKLALYIAQYMQIEEIVNLGFTLFLFLKIVYLFSRQSKLIDEVRSFDNLQWLKNFLWFAALVIGLWVVAVVFNINKTLNPDISIYLPLRLSSASLIIWIAYIGFFKLNLITERVQLRQLIADIAPKKNIEFNIYNDVFQQIETHLNTSKKFLNFDYGIADLSNETKIKERIISKSLTDAGQKNFNEYINKKRIETAKSILLSNDNGNYTMVALSFECGFRSKSTFYREFAKQTNTTPTLFRQKNS